MMCFVMLLFLLPKQSTLGKGHPLEGELLTYCVIVWSVCSLLAVQAVFVRLSNVCRHRGAAKESRELETETEVEMEVMVVGGL